jgi:hypothetical protein
MIGQPRALAYALAVLTLVAVLGLSVRLAAQVTDLKVARSDLADATGKVAELRREVAAGVGPPLLDSRVGSATGQLAERLKSLGVTVREAKVAATTPAGPNLVAVRFSIEGAADAAAVDRLALWAQANARSVILERLSATAAGDGRGEVAVELDALVRQRGVRPS